MEIKSFHWWKFDQELVEGCEIECPECLVWSSHEVWEGKLAQCLDCGIKYLALFCPACKMYVDHIHTSIRTCMPGEEPIEPVVVEEEPMILPPWKKAR